MRISSYNSTKLNTYANNPNQKSLSVTSDYSDASQPSFGLTGKGVLKDSYGYRAFQQHVWKKFYANKITWAALGTIIGWGAKVYYGW